MNCKSSERSRSNVEVGNGPRAKVFTDRFRIVPLKGLKWRSRFQNSVSEKLSHDKSIALQVRARRQPTPETIGLLEKLLSDNAGSVVKQSRRRVDEPKITTPVKGKRKKIIEKPFTIEQMKSALIAIRPEIAEPQMSMLRGHYLYRVLSMGRIAKFGGYSYYGSANLQYGKLCGRIARELGYRPTGSQTYTIASVSPDRDKKGGVPVADGQRGSEGIGKDRMV